MSRKRSKPSPQEGEQGEALPEVVFDSSLARKVQLPVDDEEEICPAAAVVDNGRNIVTPATKQPPQGSVKPAALDDFKARRQLFPAFDRPVPVTPAKSLTPKSDKSEPIAKRRLIFGRLVTVNEVADNVRRVYGIVKKLTGSIGGNGSHGPIYGELTMGSMQKMVSLMKEHTNLDSSSRFIDVGSGIGKPNLHVAQDPGVEFSYGIEVEKDRWLLGISCLKAVLAAASEEQVVAKPEGNIGHRCMFVHGDIRSAKSFNPFTHVYMFSIGFPPDLWVELSEMWNRSDSSYLICFHGPKDIIHNYEFNVELVIQTPTSMHGSKEGHTGYIYRRSQGAANATQQTSPECDPFFVVPWTVTKRGLQALKEEVGARVDEAMSSSPIRRSKRATSS